MSKKRDRSEVEHLRGVVKNQRSLIKHLKKEVGRSQKREHRVEDLEEILAEEMLEEQHQEKEYVKDDKCPQCKTKVELVDLGPKKLIICQSCGYRKTK